MGGAAAWGGEHLELLCFWSSAASTSAEQQLSWFATEGKCHVFSPGGGQEGERFPAHLTASRREEPEPGHDRCSSSSELPEPLSVLHAQNSGSEDRVNRILQRLQTANASEIKIIQIR